MSHTPTTNEFLLRIITADVCDDLKECRAILKEIEQSEQHARWQSHLNFTIEFRHNNAAVLSALAEESVAAFSDVEDPAGEILSELLRARAMVVGGQRDEGIALGDRLRERAVAEGSDLLAFRMYLFKGLSLIRSLLVEGALEPLEKCAALAERFESPILVARANSAVANCIVMQTEITHLEESKVKKALKLLEEAREVFEANDLHILVARNYTVGAGISYSQGQYDAALETMHLALSAVSKGADPVDENAHNSILCGLFTSIGTIHQRARNLDVAERYLLMALDSASSEQEKSNIYFALGINCVWAGQFEESLEWYNKSLDWIEKSGIGPQAFYCYCNIAHCLQSLNQYEEAAKYLDKAAALGEMPKVARVWFSIVKSKSLLHKGELTEGRAILQEHVEYVSDEKNRWERIELHTVLRDIALAENNLQEYVKHNDIVNVTTEELRGSKTHQQLALLEKEQEVAKERQVHERNKAVLYSTLPKSVADRVVRGETVNDHIDDASVIFLDIVGFTTISSKVPAGHVVHLLESIFSACDEVCKQFDVMKVKTIGDSYMAAAMPPTGSTQETVSSEPHHSIRAAKAALGMMKALEDLEVTMDPELGDISWINDIGELTVRIGIHSGPVVAGIVGKDRLQYDVWGDTVNVASRMESTCDAGRIHISSTFADAITSHPERIEGPQSNTDAYTVSKRGTIDIKGKGVMTTYWLEGA